MNRGDVVLVDWAYSDLTGTKLRPAVVVQADFLNGRLDDTILVQITGTRHGVSGSEVGIDPTQEPTSGLKKVSYVSYTNILTFEQIQIHQIIGYLSPSAMRQIEACLKKVFEIP
jgi:mRNA interferase MazF